MTSSIALDVFHRLIQQVYEIEGVAKGMDSARPDTAQILRRSAFVLAVAAIDAYFHEQIAVRLRHAAVRGAPHDGQVANYLQQVSAVDVSGPYGESFIRLRLSFKTLVDPKRIDAALTACGDDPNVLWRDYCFARGSRPDRERRQLELLYDRRNQIAHEGDWDIAQLDLRPMAGAHLWDCITAVSALAEGFDTLL